MAGTSSLATRTAAFWRLGALQRPVQLALRSAAPCTPSQLPGASTSLRRSICKTHFNVSVATGDTELA